MILYAGKFEQNLSVFALKHLDVGRYYTELVDTVAEHVGRGVVHAVFHFCFEFVANGIVGRTGAYEALEHDGEVGLRAALAVVAHECAHEVFGGVGVDGCLCGCYGRFEHGVGVAALHAAEHVGHIYLEDYVHAAFEVEAEAYAPFAYVIEGVSEINFLLAERVHVVFVSLVVGSVVVVAGFNERVLLGLAFMLAGNQRE